MARRSLSPRLRFAILRRDGFVCFYCGARPPEARLEVDHVEALATGGPDMACNLITSCSRCNNGKADGAQVGAARRAAYEREANLNRERVAAWRRANPEYAHPSQDDAFEELASIQPSCNDVRANEWQGSLEWWLNPGPTSPPFVLPVRPGEAN